MPDSVPASDALTVVVCSDDDDGLAVRDLAQQWHADGLLGDFAWVTPADVDRGPYGPPEIRALVSGREGTTELMAHLGRRPRAMIRVVLVHLLTHELSDPDRLVYTCDEIAELVNRARPRTIDPQGRHQGTQLLRINLMVPESDLLPQDSRIILPAWEVNAVVSPEDRPELDRQSVFVRRAANLHGHALNAAAAAGGLWADCRAGAFDSHQSDSTTGGGEVVVVRCQARVVVGDDRSDELARGVVTTLQRSAVGAAAWVGWAVPAADPAALVRSAVDGLTTHPEWAPPRHEPAPVRKGQLSLGAAVRQWAWFQLRLVPAVLHFLSGWGQGLVERWVTAVTVGRDAGDEAKLRPLPPEEVRGIAEQRLRRAEQRVRPSRLDEEAGSWGQTTPAAWRELREVALGLVDGSPLPPRVHRPTRGGAEEVLPPAFVVADPAEVHELASGDRVGPVDVEQAALALAEIEQRRREAEEARADDAARPAGGRHADRSRQEAHADELGELGPDTVDPFVAWVEERQATLLWQLTSRVVDLKRRERRRAAAARETLDALSPPTADKLEAARRLLVGAWGVTLAVLALLTLLAVLAAVDDPWGFLTALPAVDWVDVTRTVLVVVVVLLVVGTLYLQAIRSYEWAVTRQLHTMRTAGDDYVSARQQERRWQLMQAGLVDWATVLGELLHRPWVPRSTPPSAVPAYAGLPAAVAVAVHADQDQETDPRVVGLAIEHVCQKGWLTAELAHVVAASPLNASSAARGGPGAAYGPGDLPADLDLGLRAHGPRRDLAAAAAAESTKQAATDALVTRLRALLRSGDVRLPPHTVVRVGRWSEGETMLDRDFLTPRDHVAPFVTELFSPEAQLAQHQVPERTVLCLPPGISPPPSLASALRAEVHTGQGTTAVQVDVSPLVGSDCITLFRRVRRAEYHPTTAPDDFN